VHLRHFRKVGIASFASFDAPNKSAAIVCLAPRVLSLTPQVTFSFSAGRPRFRCLPPFGSYCVSAVIAGLPAPSHRIAQSATVLSFFTLSVATPERCGGWSCSFKTAGVRTTTLAHSSNFRSWIDRLCPLPRPKPRTTEASLGLRLVFAIYATCFRVINRGRAPPDFLVVNARRNDPPRGSR